MSDKVRLLSRYTYAKTFKLDQNYIADQIISSSSLYRRSPYHLQAHFFIIDTLWEPSTLLGRSYVSELLTSWF